MKCSWFGYLLIGLISLGSAALKKLDYEFDLQRIEAVPGDKETIYDVSNIKVIKKNKRYYVNGTLTLSKDVDNNYLCGINIQHSPMGNSRFIQSPLKVPATPYCDFINTTFKALIEPSIIGKSNFPVIPPEGLCPIPKGTYYIKEVELSEDTLPSHVSSGVWKVEKFLSLEFDHVGALRAYIKVVA